VVAKFVIKILARRTVRSIRKINPRYGTVPLGQFFDRTSIHCPKSDPDVDMLVDDIQSAANVKKGVEAIFKFIEDLECPLQVA